MSFESRYVIKHLKTKRNSYLIYLKIYKLDNSKVTYPVASQSISRFSGRYRWGKSKSSSIGSEMKKIFKWMIISDDFLNNVRVKCFPY